MQDLRFIFVSMTHFLVYKGHFYYFNCYFLNVIK